MAEKLDRNLSKAYNHGSHHLVRLTYISRASDGLDASQRKEILNTARTNNSANGISGILIFNKDYFLQTIEGSRPLINGLLNALIADPRHHDLQIIECETVYERKWVKWSMNYVTPTASNKDDFMKFSTDLEFNPYTMNKTSLQKLITSLYERQQKLKEEAANTPKKKWFFG